MPDSDVVIGWVTADGETMFHVSFNLHKAIIAVAPPSGRRNLSCGKLHAQSSALVFCYVAPDDVRAY